MSEESQAKRIGYTPSEKMNAFIENFTEGEDALLSKSQLVEISIRFLADHTEEEIERIISKYALGKKKHEKTRVKKMA